MLARYKWYIIGYAVVFALVHACTYTMFYGEGGLDFLWPLYILPFALGYGGGDFGIIVGDLITSLIITVVLSIILNRVWKMKGDQEMTWVLGAKMLGLFILYLAIIPIFFAILFFPW